MGYRVFSFVGVFVAIYFIMCITIGLHTVNAEQQSRSLSTNCSGGGGQLCETITCVQYQPCYISKSSDPDLIRHSNSIHTSEDAGTIQPLEDAGTNYPYNN